MQEYTYTKVHTYACTYVHTYKGRVHPLKAQNKEDETIKSSLFLFCPFSSSLNKRTWHSINNIAMKPPDKIVKFKFAHTDVCIDVHIIYKCMKNIGI